MNRKEKLSFVDSILFLTGLIAVANLSIRFTRHLLGLSDAGLGFEISAFILLVIGLITFISPLGDHIGKAWDKYEEAITSGLKIVGFVVLVYLLLMLL